MADLELVTAQARGAIAVLRVSGTTAIEVADRVFRPASGNGLTSTEMNRLRLGRVGAGLGDEVVAVITDRTIPSVEFQCHGGVMAVELVSTALLEAGARWREGPYRQSNLLERQAQEDLTHAPTVTTAAILLEQSLGSLRENIGEVLEDMSANRWHMASERLDRLLSNGRLGLRLLTGWRVAIAGRPNAGKSRLMNALAGYERTIVDETPGTTRDAVRVHAAIGGWPLDFIDTAGLRISDDEIELQGIARSRAEHARADLVLLLLDRSVALTDEDLNLLEEMPEALLVASKADLPAAWTANQVELSGRSIVVVSAQKRHGMDRLIESILARLIADAPAAGEGVPFRAEQCAAIEQARQFVLEGRLDDGRRALAALLS